MSISHESKLDLQWWRTSVLDAYNPISHGEIEVTLKINASLTGWGACIDITTTGGNWSPTDKENDINYLEILVAFLALQSFSFALAGKHV